MWSFSSAIRFLPVFRSFALMAQSPPIDVRVLAVNADRLSRIMQDSVEYYSKLRGLVMCKIGRDCSADQTRVEIIYRNARQVIDLHAKAVEKTVEYLNGRTGR
jgi:hypothetical protein